jgi:hypothetical protein
MGFIAAVFLIPLLVRMTRDWRQRRLDAPRLAALKLKRQIAASEAALGIPVATDGRCPVCQAPRVAGASFCTHCRSALTSFPTAHPLPLIVCLRCSERQPEGGRFCWACGARLLQSKSEEAAELDGAAVTATTHSWQGL